MPLHLKCPLCGKTAVVPDAAINRRVECGFCHATHHVRDIVHRHEPSAAPDAPPEQGVARSEKVLLASCCGLPAALLLVFLAYWFGFRDTWELDNYTRIMQQCDAVERALAQSDDAAAAEAYAELNSVIGERTVKHRNLTARLAETRTAFTPVNARLEEAEREREAQRLAERRRAEALAHAKARSAMSDKCDVAPRARRTPYLTRDEAIDAYADQQVERHWRPMPGGNTREDAKRVTRDILKARNWQEFEAVMEKHIREGR